MPSDIDGVIQRAKDMSCIYGRSWLMSNGDELMIATSIKQKELCIGMGFWAAATFEQGVRVES